MPKRSPMYDQEKARGARFGAYCDWEIAEHFGDPRREYEFVRGRAGALDLCYLGGLRASGRDRVRFLHNMLTNDISNLKTGAGCHALLLTRQGHVVSDLYVYASAEEIWMECPPSGKNGLVETLDQSIVGDVVQIEDRSEALAVLSLQGPGSRDIVERSTGASLEGMPPLAHKDIVRTGGTWVVTHRDRTGCDGYDVRLPAADAAGVWSRWLDNEAVCPVGHLALNWLRTEAGIPWFGVDIAEHNLPMEFGLDSAISMTKGCYRGQEIVARVVHRGHLNRGFGAIAVDCPEVPARGAEVRCLEEKVGEVTSAILSPRLGKPLALAILRKDVLRPGTRAGVLCGGANRPGEVVALPLA